MANDLTAEIDEARARMRGRDPWRTLESDFPQRAALPAQLEFVVQHALLAPSSHNSQPWCFAIIGNEIDLIADRSRGLPVADPYDRELTISCGAALFALRVALHRFGFDADVRRFPSSSDADHLARVRVTQGHDTSEAERHLFAALGRRRTTRFVFEPRSISSPLCQKLGQACEEEGAWLWWINREADRERLIQLVMRADQLQWTDPHFRRELAGWMHATRGRSHDGMPGYAMGMSDIVASAAPFFMRTFDLGEGAAARDEAIARHSGALAILGTHGDTAADWLAAGEALMHMLLLATDAGVTASYLNQPIEVEETRADVRALVDHAFWPQLCMRFGFAPTRAPTPRRPLGEVLL